MPNKPRTADVRQPVTDDSIKVRHLSHYQFSWTAHGGAATAGGRAPAGIVPICGPPLLLRDPLTPLGKNPPEVAVVVRYTTLSAWACPSPGASQALVHRWASADVRDHPIRLRRRRCGGPTLAAPAGAP